jgi:hypothetical protein
MGGGVSLVVVDGVFLVFYANYTRMYSATGCNDGWVVGGWGPLHVSCCVPVNRQLTTKNVEGASDTALVQASHEHHKQTLFVRRNDLPTPLPAFPPIHHHILHEPWLLKVVHSRS